MRRAGARNYLPFSYRLMLSYSVFIIVLILLGGYALNAVFVGSIQDRTREINTGTIQQMRDNITYKVDDLVRISNMIYLDDTLSKHLRHYEEGWASYEVTTKYLLPKLNTTIEAANDSIWLSVYLHNAALPEIYLDHNHTDPLRAGRSVFDLYNIRRIQDKSWYKRFPKEKYGETMEWKQIEDDARYGRISLLRRIVDTNSPIRLEERGFIRISTSLTTLLESVDYDKIGEGTALFITDAKGTIMSSSGQTKWLAGDRLPGGTEDVLEIREEIPRLDWYLVAWVPKNLTERATDKVRFWTFAVCFASILLFSFAGYLVSRLFAKKVNKIVTVLDLFQQGDFQKRIHFKGRDEFTEISESLNEMGQNIGDLIREVYITKIQKKEAELESLQAQINPHFLYNTLSSISRLAQFGQLDKQQQMVLDLAKFYRLSLNEGRTVIPIRSELEQVEAYINIQRTKYGDSVAVRYDIEPELDQYNTIKLILQPFVENVFEHARFEDRVHIRIVGELAGADVVFKIIDDGIGIHPSVVRRILHPIESVDVGYGIRNVHQRIRLHYGEDYGVAIYSRPGIGTTVRIQFPRSSGNKE
ncbi:histidine kinase [Paenibacillus swuensis]|uniref:histidine kinase n=1 Tax=Paenibacillus swuensis TaxID=1178515 RepID=A0A172TFD6_9BACL|nr:sensor histidine kinase [Paenibacillus swuensis]ANE45775.1 histidine kinase [Paenibacillus swuensis]